ncbi:hypothetical protein ACFQ6N_24760 [Kitasatospora sp. NPDC056446]|uniref:hypothetical protein n=1 Tax=Kitasatospora sp. NPDC056446 TaxID=3345819 RepID=UPI0036990FA4
MTGIEVAVGYVFAWLVGKVGRVADRADGEVDRALDAGMDRLHTLVSGRIGADPALERAEQEAAAGQDEPSERTRRRLVDSLEDAAERDPAFGRALQDLVDELRASDRSPRPAGGPTVSGNTFNGPTAFQVGDHNRQHNKFGN